MSKLRRTAVLLLGLGLLGLLLFLKGRPEPVVPRTTPPTVGPLVTEIGPKIASAPARPAREAVPFNTKPKAKTDVLDKISPGITAAPAGAGAAFVMRDRYASTFFANGQLAIALSGRKGPKAGRQQGYGLHWSPEGASDADPKPRGELQARVSRMVGDSRTWAVDQKTYGAIDYDAILPGIDMTVESRPHGLKYTLYAQAGAELSNLRFNYRGAGGIEVVQDGAGINILTDLGTVTENELHCWQDGPSGRRTVEARYVALGVDSYQIVLGDYDPSLPMTIDPTISFSTYIGATVAPNQDYEDAWGIAVDSANPPNVYVTGSTSSVDFPKVGALDPTLGGSNDIFVTKIQPTFAPANQIVWSTYLGGASDDTGYSIAVDAAQNVYVTGYTNSSDFPMAGNPIRTTLQSSEVFVSKINAAGNTLVYSTFLGGSDSESGYGIVVDNAPTPNIYVAGYTYSTNFVPAPNGFDTNYSPGYTEGFIVKIDGTKLAGGGSATSWSTLLGGNSYDYIWNMCIDANANIYVTGASASTASFPLNNAYRTSPSGGYDAIIAKLNSAGALLYSTFVGGNDYDIAYAIAVDNVAIPNIYITGYTYSNNLPTVVTSYQKNIASTVDAFVVKMNPAAVPTAQVVWCSYLGGSSTEYGYGINVDSAGNAMVSGYTSSSPLSLAVVPGFDQTSNGSWDGFVARFNNTGTGLLAWTYLGGASTEYVRNSAMDSSGNVYVVGNTYSTNFPATGGFQNSLNGYGDAFVAKINPNCGLPWASYLGGANGPAMDEVRRVEFDGLGNMYITGITNGSDFPPAGTPFNGALKGDQDCFVSKISVPAPPALPTLVWTAYLGGTYWDEPNALAVHPSGNFLVVGGYSESDDFPHSAAYPNNAGSDGFITKINSTGSSCTIAWSRFLAGSSGGNVQGLALDSIGDVYSTGYTSSGDIPDMLVTGYQPALSGGADAFVIKHDAVTGAVARSTYFGGTLDEITYAIAIDSLNRVIIGGYTNSTVTFPTAGGPFQATNQGNYDSFVSRFDSNLNTLNYSTFLGGGSYDFIYDLTVDTSNNIYVTGYTQSTNFPTRAGALSLTLSGTVDAFVSKINPSLVGAAQLVWSTYLGGSGTENPYRIRVDSVGSVYVVGVTYSPDFPLKNAFDNTSINGEAFITRINNPTGSTLQLAWSSFLGGSEIDQAYGMAFGPGGSIYVVGYTQSPNFNFPTPPPVMPDTTLSGQEGFVTRIDNQDPNMPLLLQQFRTDGVTSIPLSAWTNQTQIVIKANVTDAEEDQVRLRVEVKPITAIFDGLGTVDSPLSATGTISMLVDLPTGSGTEFHWRCRSVDQHGHLSPWNSFGANGDGATGPPFVNAGRDVGFDNTPPVPTIATPTNQPTYFTQLGTISLSGTTSDPLSGVALVEWRNNLPLPGGTAYVAAGGTPDNWSVGSIALSSTNGGVNTITVRATDNAGNQGTDVITVTWDTLLPTLSITSPAIPPASYTTGSGSVLLSGTMSDNNGVSAVNWSRSGGGVPTTNGFGNITGGGATWNATVALAPGTNTITVTAQDAAGNNSTGPSGVLTVIFDNVAPSITINTPSQTTTATSIDIQGTAADSSGISLVTWSSNRGFNGTATGTTSWNTTAPPQVTLAGGVNVITFTAYDGVNNPATAQVTITRDVNAPVVTITNPPNAGTYITATTPLTIGGSATDDIAVQKVEWQSDREGGSPFHNITNLTGPVNSRSWLATGPEAVGLLSGVNVITVRVTDTSNRTGTTTLTVTYNANAPSLVISNPPTASFVTLSASINVAGSATSGGPGIFITGITVQNLTTGVFSTFTPTGLGTTSASFTGGNAAPVSLVQGTNTIEVKATDTTPLTTTATLTIIHDPTVPAVTITGPTGFGTWAQGTATLALSGVASDNRGVTSVLVSNTTTGVLDQPATLVGPATSLTWSASIGLSLLSVNNIVVTAKDEAGNTTTDILSVTYDTTLPTISITTPTSAPTFVTSGVISITIGGSINDNIGISTITWSNARNGAAGVGTGSPTWSAPSVPLDPGINVITVIAKDTAGNTRNASITIYLDTAIPTVMITAPTISGSYNTSTATISVGGTAADDIGVAFVTWTSQGTGPLKSGSATGTTTWSIDSIPLDPGNNTITVTAHDGRNALSDDALSTSKLIVNYDSLKPTLTIQVPTPPTFSTTDTPVLVSGIAGDGVGVTEVSWVNTATGGSGTAAGTTNWSALIPLTSGANLINIKAKDAAGNSEVKSITITYDPAAPLVTITSPTTAVSITTGSSPITIGGTAQDDVGLAGVTWSTGGVPVLVNTSNGFLDWSGPVTLSPGSNDVTFTATDTVGRTGTTRITIIYDPDAPTVTITSPTADPIYLTTNPTITLGGVASDNLSVQSVQWSNAATLDSGSAVGVGLWNVPTIDLIEGANDITVTVTDSVGNVNTDVITVIYDGTTPVIAITAPVIVFPATSFPTNIRPFTISGTASDNLGLGSITFTNDRGGGGNAVPTPALPATSVTWTAAVYLSPGLNVITIKATDQHGYFSTASITIDFTPENIAPTIAITQPPGGSAVSATQLIDISGTASDNIGVVKVVWKNNLTGLKGTAVLSAPVPPDPDPNLVNWLGTIPLARGANQIVVTVIDDADNQTTSTITVTYDPPSDGTLPGITIVNPNVAVYDATTAPLLITLDASDNDGIASVTWSNAGTGSSGYATFVTGTTWEASIALAINANAITFTAHDPSGNTATDDIIVNFNPGNSDIANPVVTITSHPTGVALNVSSPTLTLSGVASDNVLVADVVWLNAATSASGGADGTTAWQAPLILVPGTNVITLRVYDSSGNTDTDQITVNYSPPPPFVPAGHCGLLGVDGLLLAAAAWLLRRRGR